MTGIEFVNGEDTDAGTITLDPGCTSEFEIIEVLGDFNAWTPLGQMTEV